MMTGTAIAMMAISIIAALLRLMLHPSKTQLKNWPTGTHGCRSQLRM
jgi:hypothetical protein